MFKPGEARPLLWAYLDQLSQVLDSVTDPVPVEDNDDEGDEFEYDESDEFEYDDSDDWILDHDPRDG